MYFYYVKWCMRAYKAIDIGIIMQILLVKYINLKDVIVIQYHFISQN